MVKLYLMKKGTKSKEHIDINIWSLVKAYFLAGLILTGIVYGVILIFFLFFGAIALMAAF
jgi:hypothetical protein